MTLYLIGYSGATCSRNILVNTRGFAGLDVEMQRRLLALIEASPIDGDHYSLGFGEGFRDSTAQAAEFLRRHFLDPNGKLVYLGKRYTLKPGYAPLAPPGASYHEATTRGGKALAADLVGNLGWAHENVSRFGLMNFRQTGAKPEPWHHQPVEIPTARRNYNGSYDPLPVWSLPGEPVAPMVPSVGVGSSGPLVAAVQQILAERASQDVGPFDGQFGARTLAGWRNVVAYVPELSRDDVIDGADWDVLAWIDRGWDRLYAAGFPKAA